MLVLKEGVGDGTEFVVNALRDFEPVKGTEVGSDVVVFWDFADDTGKTVLDVLKACYLIGRKVEIEGVTVIEFGVDEGSGNGFSGVEVEVERIRQRSWMCQLQDLQTEEICSLKER